MRQRLEWVAVRLALAVVPHLSRRTVLRVAQGLAAAAFRLGRHLRRVGRTNLDIAFGDRLPRERKEGILKASYRNLALTLLDVLWFSRDAERRFREWVIPDDDMRARVFRPGAQVLFSGHFGNWEVIGQMVARQGYPLMSVAAPLANERVDEIFLRLRRQSGQQIVSKEGAILRLFRHLRQDGKVAMLLDQNTKPADGGVFVEFFGLPVPVSAAAAHLALRAGCGLWLGHCTCDAHGRYRCTVLEEVDRSGIEQLPRDEAAREITRRITRQVEEVIRASPEHWLWMYKRWKHVPPGADPTAYPFYSKPLP